MNQNNLALAALGVYFQTNESITSLDFKNNLRELYPDQQQNQHGVSAFLAADTYSDKYMDIYIDKDTIINSPLPEQLL